MPDWMPNVEHIPTRAQGGPIQPIAIMSHIMQGHQRTMIDWARERPWLTPKSAHFTIGKNGRIVQHVGIRNEAWHAGNVESPTWELLPRGVNPNFLCVGIEHEGWTGQPWTSDMWEATLNVHEWVFKELDLPPSKLTVIGHYETATVSRRHDPGSAWDKNRVIEYLKSFHQGEILDHLTQAEAETHFLNGLFEVQGHRSYYEEEGNLKRMILEWK